jgi:hypothetical protein
MRVIQAKSFKSFLKPLPSATDEFAGKNFPDEITKLIVEIQEKINRLRQSGINEMLLKSLFSFDTERKFSRMLITKDYRIILPDYNDMEIHLPPLPKAVFFLFLKHPEGILFKYLSNYRGELMNIYLKLSNRENLAKMAKSIDDIVNPTKNAINEKCSRIREAFVKEFDDELAQYYFFLFLLCIRLIRVQSILGYGWF